MAKEFAKKFYKSKEWQKARRLALIRDKGLCQRCGLPAEEVHHKEHLTSSNINDSSISLGLDNLESLCKDCHFKEHEEERTSGRLINDTVEGFIFSEDGFLIPAPPEN